MGTRRGNNYLRRSTRFAHSRRSLWGTGRRADVEISTTITAKDLEVLLYDVAEEERESLITDGKDRVAESNRAVIVRVEGNAAAIFGGKIVEPGVAHVWAAVTERMRGRGLMMTRLVLQLIEESREKYGPLRYFTWCLSGALVNSRWLNALDFARYPEIDFDDDVGNTWEGYLR